MDGKRQGFGGAAADPANGAPRLSASAVAGRFHTSMVAIAIGSWTSSGRVKPMAQGEQSDSSITRV